jgi:hypothetical protein
LIVHVIKRDTALWLKRRGGRRDQQGVDRANRAIRRIAVGEEERRREMSLRGVDGVGRDSWGDSAR